MSDSKFTRRSLGGKGYYIALILCAAAIGISGYLYFKNADGQHDKTVSAVDPTQEDVAVVATQLTEEPTQSVKKTEKLKTTFPVIGKTVAEFAMDCLSYNETTRDFRVHNGVDIAAEANMDVCAAADGTVYSIYEDDSLGTTVVLHHADGYTTKYASLAENPSVSVGDTVRLGQKIGCVGNTALLETALGDHVHFSVLHNDEVMNPMDFLQEP